MPDHDAIINWSFWLQSKWKSSNWEKMLTFEGLLPTSEIGTCINLACSDSENQLSKKWIHRNVIEKRGLRGQSFLSPMHSGQYCQFLAHNKIRILFKFGQAKKLIFLYFDAFFGDFSDFGTKVFNLFFNFRAQNFHFWASKLMKIYFCAEKFMFLYEPKLVNISHCAIGKSENYYCVWEWNAL